MARAESENNIAATVSTPRAILDLRPPRSKARAMTSDLIIILLQSKLGCRSLGVTGISGRFRERVRPVTFGTHARTNALTILGVSARPAFAIERREFLV